MKTVRAECIDCGKVWDTKNAQGVAAIHAKKYKHEVMVDVCVSYNENGKKTK